MVVNFTHVPTSLHSGWLCEFSVLSKLSDSMFNTVLDSLGRKKAKEKLRFSNARILQRQTNHEELQGLTQTPFCKCVSWTKGQCSSQGRARYQFPAFFFKSLGPCRQTNIYFSWKKESHSTQLTRVWLLGRGASRHVPRQPARKCTDLLEGLYWWCRRQIGACGKNCHPWILSAPSWPAHSSARKSWKVCPVPWEICCPNMCK